MRKEWQPLEDDKIAQELSLKGWLHQETAELAAFYRQERRFIHAMKNLVRIWLYKKHRTTLINTEDPVTLLEPTQPVFV